MTASSPGGKEWRFNAGEKIKNSQSASDLQKRLQEGVTVSISNGNTSLYLLVQAYFPGNTPFDGEASTWQLVADKAQQVFENFVEQMITTGLLDPLLNPNTLGDLNIEVSQLEMSFAQIGKEFQYQGHEYFDKKDSKTSIEKHQENGYKKATDRLHKGDENKSKDQLIKTVQGIHEALVEKDPFHFHSMQHVEKLYAALKDKSLPNREALKQLLTDSDFGTKENLLSEILDLSKRYLEESKRPVVFEAIAEILLNSLNDPSYIEENKALLKSSELKQRLIEKDPLAMISFAQKNALPDLEEKALKAFDQLSLEEQLKQITALATENTIPEKILKLFVDKVKKEKDPTQAQKLFNEINSLSNEKLKEAKEHLALVIFAHNPENPEAVAMVRGKYLNKQVLKIALFNLSLNASLIEERMNDLFPLHADQGIIVREKGNGINYEDMFDLFKDCLHEKGYDIALELAAEILSDAPDHIKEQCKKSLKDNFQDSNLKKACLLHETIAPLLVSAPEILEESSVNAPDSLLSIVKSYSSVFDQSRTFEKEYKNMSIDQRLQEIEKLEGQILAIERFILQEETSNAASYTEKMEAILSEVLREKPELNGKFIGVNLVNEKLEIAKQALLPMITLDEQLDPIELQDLKELEDIKACWEKDGLIHPNEDTDYLNYIQKVAHCMQQYQKERRSLSPNPEILKRIEALKEEWKRAELTCIPQDDKAFFDCLLGDEAIYQLAYFSPEAPRYTEHSLLGHSSGSLELDREQKNAMVGDRLHYYPTSGDGNCSINSLGFSMIGLMYQGRYEEEARFIKLLKEGDELLKAPQKKSEGGTVVDLDIQKKINTNLYGILKAVFDQLPEDKQKILADKGFNEDFLESLQDFLSLDPPLCTSTLEFYNLLREVFSTGNSSYEKPFDLLFKLKSPQRNTIIGKLQEILSLSLRKVIVKKIKKEGKVEAEVDKQIKSFQKSNGRDFDAAKKIEKVLNNTFNQAKDALPIVRDIEEVRGDPELMFHPSVPFSVKTVLRSLNSNLLSAFASYLKNGSVDSSVNDYFKFDGHLLQILEALADSHPKDPYLDSDATVVMVKGELGDSGSELHKSWMKLLKIAFIDHVTVIDAHNVWMHGSELLSLAEELSSENTQLNLFIHGASNNSYLGEIPQDEWQALSSEQRSFLRGIDFVDPDGLFKEYPRGRIISYMNSEKGKVYLKKRLEDSDDFRSLSNEQQKIKLKEQRKVITEWMLKWHDEHYLRESYWKRKKIITVGMRYSARDLHFEYGTNDQGAFDMTQPQNGLSSYDDIDNWDSIYADIEKFIASSEKKKEEYKRILALFHYKSLCMGGQASLPGKLLKVKEKMNDVMGGVS